MVGNTHQLQNRSSEIGRWFMKAAKSINSRAVEGETCQGFYVLGANGRAYEFGNSRSVPRMLSLLASGLDEYWIDPPGYVEVSDLESFDVEPPEGTTVLRTYSRITPLPPGAHSSNGNLQRDHFWLLGSEVSALVDGSVPDSLQLRLCKYAFVDAVRGEPVFWRGSDIVSRSFSVDRKSDGTLSLRGAFEMYRDGHGFAGSFRSELVVEKGVVTSFLGVAAGLATGNGIFTPNAPEGSFPLKIGFVLAPEGSVAPQATYLGRTYLAGG